MRRPVSCFFVLLAACTPEVRFPDRALLWKEPDDQAIAVPQEREAWGTWIGVRDALFANADRVLALEPGREATNVNAIDEVPDSSWYVDPRRQIAEDGAVTLRPLGRDAIERGRLGDELKPRLPLTVVQGKPAGANLGFIVKDARGVKYALKIDPPGLVGLDTSTEVVVSRLAWAAGWFVPDEVLIDFRPSDLRLAPTAKTKDGYDRRVPFTHEQLDEMLCSLPRRRDGTVRAVASRWIEGKIVGPFTFFGRRGDDANDRVPHEARRDLRAFGIFSEWVNNIDALETNTLDSYVGKAGQGHLVHYQQDVGGAFGSRSAGPIQYWMGSDPYLSPSTILKSLLTLGLLPRRWEGERIRRERARLDATWPELGFFDAEHLDVRGWQPVLENPAFTRQTARDRYWGMKRLLAFTDEELRAAIALGSYRPEAAERLFRVLVDRRQKMARAFLGDVAALDSFHLSSSALCWDDLWVDAGLGGARAIAYAAGENGVGLEVTRQCTQVPSRGGYRVIEVRVHRPGERGFDHGVRVHFIEREGKRRIVGVER